MDFVEKTQAIEGLKAQFLDQHPEWMVLAVRRDPALKRYVKNDVPVTELTGDDLYIEGLRSELMSYPGLTAIATHVHAKTLYDEAKASGKKDDPRFAQAREWGEVAHTLSGIDIHPGANISPLTFIDHGTGDVIGETASVGEGTIIFQGVTLGGYGNVPDGQPRHPTIGKDVVISTGAKIYGNCRIGDGVKIDPDVQIIRSTVGAGAVIGAGVRLQNFDVPPNTRVTAEGQRILLTPIQGITPREKAQSKWFAHTRVMDGGDVRALYEAAVAKGEAGKGL